MKENDIIRYFQARTSKEICNKINKGIADKWDVGNKTAFFSDVNNFEKIIGKLDTGAAMKFVDYYLEEMLTVLIQNNGTFVQYIGDQIIAIFGAPVNYEDHAVRACNTIVAMKEKVSEIALKWESEYPKTKGLFSIRCGVSTGEISTGFVGPENLQHYTIVGNAVNLAARCESGCAEYRVGNLVAGSTYNLTKDLFDYRYVAKYHTKSGSIAAYELLGPK